MSTHPRISFKVSPELKSIYLELAKPLNATRTDREPIWRKNLDTNLRRVVKDAIYSTLIDLQAENPHDENLEATLQALNAHLKTI